MRNIVFVFMVVTVQMLYAAVETAAGQYCSNFDEEPLVL